MLIACGYILNDDQLKALGASRGLTIEHREIYKLDANLRQHHIYSVQALPVDYPRSTPGVPPVPRTLMATRYKRGSEDQILHPVPCVEEDGDRKVRTWLEHNGVWNTEFVTVPDPYSKMNKVSDQADETTLGP